MTKLNVYLAGASADIERCGALMKALHGIPNVRVTYDWVAAVKEQGPEHGLMRSTRRHYALKDRQGVREADVLWLALPPEGVNTDGAWWELGYYQALCDVEWGLQSAFGWEMGGLCLIPKTERIIALSTADGEPVRMTLFAEIPCEGGRDVSADLVVLNWIRSEAELLAGRS